MSTRRNTTIAGTVAGLGLTAAGIVVGTLVSKRRKGAYDDAPSRTRKSPEGEHALVGKTVTIRKPRAELYEFWRDFSRLPEVMENVESIEDQSDHYLWRIKAPAGRTVELKTRIVEETKPSRIAWESVDGSQIETRGHVAFSDAPGERGTRVTLVIEYDPPGGALGRSIAKLFLREPEVQARHDLKRFKMLMETGEVATSARRKENTRAAEQQEKEA